MTAQHVEWFNRWRETYGRRYRELGAYPELPSVDREVESWFALRTRRPPPPKPPPSRALTWLKRKRT